MSREGPSVTAYRPETGPAANSSTRSPAANGLLPEAREVALHRGGGLMAWQLASVVEPVDVRFPAEPGGLAAGEEDVAAGVLGDRGLGCQPTLDDRECLRVADPRETRECRRIAVGQGARLLHETGLELGSG